MHLLVRNGHSKPLDHVGKRSPSLGSLLSQRHRFSQGTLGQCSRPGLASVGIAPATGIQAPVFYLKVNLCFGNSVLFCKV